MKKGILYSKGIEYYEKGNKKMKDILKKEKEMVEEYHIMIFGNKICEGEFKEDLLGKGIFYDKNGNKIYEFLDKW